VVKRRGRPPRKPPFEALDWMMTPDDADPLLEALARDRLAHPDHPPRAIDCDSLADLLGGGKPPDDA